MPGNAQNYSKYCVSFSSRMSGAIKIGFCIETANLFNHSKWVCLGMSEIIESNKLTVSQKMNIGMNLILCACHNYMHLYDSIP